MWKSGLRPRYSFSGNICFEISVFCTCSVYIISQHSQIPSLPLILSLIVNFNFLYLIYLCLSVFLFFFFSHSYFPTAIFHSFFYPHLDLNCLPHRPLLFDSLFSFPHNYEGSFCILTLTTPPPPPPQPSFPISVSSSPDTPSHGLINYVDTKEKCRHLTKINMQRDFEVGDAEFIDWRYSQSYWYF